MRSAKNDIRLNIGCGGRPLRGYINIDFDDIETMKLRYPNQEFPDGVEISIPNVRATSPPR